MKRLIFLLILISYGASAFSRHLPTDTVRDYPIIDFEWLKKEISRNPIYEAYAGVPSTYEKEGFIGFFDNVDRIVDFAQIDSVYMATDFSPYSWIPSYPDNWREFIDTALFRKEVRNCVYYGCTESEWHMFGDLIVCWYNDWEKSWVNFYCVADSNLIMSEKLVYRKYDSSTDEDRIKDSSSLGETRALNKANRELVDLIFSDSRTIENGKYIWLNTKDTVEGTLKHLPDSSYMQHYSIDEVVVPKNLSSVGNFAFSECINLKHIDYSGNECLDTIGKFAFYYCLSLREMELPNSVEYVGDYAFFRCEHLENIVLTDSLKTISRGMFQQCESLNGVVLPRAVEKVEEFAFLECQSLKTLIILNPIPPDVSKFAFDKDNDIEICVPQESVEAYKAHKVWGTMDIYFI